MTLYALCAGVSDYSQWRNIGWNTPDLPSSVKNAEDFAQLLIANFGAQAENVGIQRDSWCSSGNFLTAFHDLVQKAQAGDSLCVFFSGHGSRLAASSIPDKPAELWYNAILPYGGSAVTDYDIASLTQALDASKVSLTLVLDTGFAGGVRSVPGAPQPLGVALDDAMSESFIQYCHTLVPVGLGIQNPMVTLAGNISAISKTPSGQASITLQSNANQVDSAKAIVYSACAEDEVAWQVRDPKNPELQNSLFVAAWKQVAAQANGQISLSNTDLLANLKTQSDQLMTQMVRRIASYSKFNQVPQLYCSASALSQNALSASTASVSG